MALAASSARTGLAVARSLAHAADVSTSTRVTTTRLSTYGAGVVLIGLSQVPGWVTAGHAAVGGVVAGTARVVGVGAGAASEGALLAGAAEVDQVEAGTATDGQVLVGAAPR
jgi:hypothetical protein